MQRTGHYGLSDSPQFLVARGPPPHMFSLSHDNISLSPPAGHAHQSHHSHQHHLPHHFESQHLHFGGHQIHPSLQALQQIHQTQSPHASHVHRAQHSQHAQHPPHPLAQLQQVSQQSAPHTPASHQDVSQHQLQQVHQQQQQEEQHKQHLREQQQAQEQQHAQEQMVQQLGLGDPDSPDAASPIASRPSPTNYSKLLMSAQQDDEGLEEDRGGSGGNRWPRAETLALIQIRSDLDSSFRDSGVKGPLWEDVSRKLAEMGYNRSGKKCKEKFENIHKYYKKSKDGRAGRQDGKSYRFFAQLDALFGGQQTSTQVDTDTAAAVLLIGNAPPLGISPTDQDLNASVQRPLEISTGITVSRSSGDDNDDDDGPGSGLRDNQQMTKNRKRKLMEDGKTGTHKLQFFETLMKNMIDKQEAMQRKLLETMERIEQDRQAKQESWRRQEMARWQREHALRAHEHALTTARDGALISFLQKVTAHNVQIPKFNTPPQVVIPPTRESEE
ncbi:trihelix transcription factor GTL1 [Physcomitrium patens]|uniref:Myb-like domain-containing protein n=1 Tax=Physcomitrium patens TaxID=3218 RepID=A0A2K1J0Q5_PHYPA|nr:trihelix transcription factor GTL1-like [Physcomitrium patens]PNR35097.1 hypothetical protein PHYPA_022996 [Physcomitrium patens]|eukprot:XP_024402506.1 trihelix transcription factor GTL1-like [Physcomitrella patens]